MPNKFSVAAAALFVSLLLVGCSESNANIEDLALEKSLAENLDLFFAKNIDSAGPGVAIKVMSGGALQYDKAFGLSQIENAIPISSSTPFYLASVSKQFTSMAVMILAEKGLLDYNDSIRRFFPEAPASWGPITIHHILTHQSGLPDFFDPLWDQIEGITNSQVLRWAIEDSTLEFGPGTQVAYSNTGYVILALLVERASRAPIEVFMKNNIFKLAGMDHTFVSNEERPIIEERAIGYNAEGEIEDYKAFTVGSGGIYSTADDLIKWSAAIDANLFVSAKTFETAVNRHVDNFDGDYGYGYGWVLSEKNEDKIIIHTGGNQGFRALLTKIPNKDVTIIILSNGSHGWLLPINDKIIDYLYSKTPEQR